MKTTAGKSSKPLRRRALAACLSAVHVTLFVTTTARAQVGGSPSDEQLLQDVRSEWSLDSGFSDAAIRASFDRQYYGIDWRDWLTVFHCSGEVLQAADGGEFGEASGALAALSLYAFDASTRLLLLSSQTEAFRIQHELYLEVRTFNSAQEIANLQPFDFLNGVDTTKEGNGWLFTYSGYLRPLPTGTQPANFWPLAEGLWQFYAVGLPQRAQERLVFRAMPHPGGWDGFIGEDGRRAA